MNDQSYIEGFELKEGQFEGDKTVSWAAYQEARLLSNTEFLHDLYTLINAENDSDKRQQLYFLIGQIAKNTQLLEATIYLTNKLKEEKKPAILESLLRCLAEIYKPGIVDLTPIYTLIDHRNSHVRYSAFAALTNIEGDIEPLLTDHLKKATKRDDIFFLLAAVKYVATDRSLAVIEPHLKNRVYEIKWLALDAIALILLRKGYSYSRVKDKLSIPMQKLQLNDTWLKNLEINLNSLTRLGHKYST